MKILMKVCLASFRDIKHDGLQALMIYLGYSLLRRATGLDFRFIISRTSDKSKMAELLEEVAYSDDTLLLQFDEEMSPRQLNRTLPPKVGIAERNFLSHNLAFSQCQWRISNQLRANLLTA